MKKESTVEVKEVEEKTMYLTQQFGEGTLGKTKFNASFVLPSMGLIVTVEKKRYLVSSQDIIEGIITIHEKENQK